VTRRTERVAAELRALLARLLREEVADPRIGLVTLTRIDVAPDLTNAIVFWSALGTTQHDALASCQEGLESAAAFLRRRAARELSLKRMPEIRFRYDPSLALGSRMLGLLRELEAPAPGAPGETPADDET
jgi:ribosome-binding factor A